jgi:hypothetical protein
MYESNLHVIALALNGPVCSCYYLSGYKGI